MPEVSDMQVIVDAHSLCPPPPQLDYEKKKKEEGKRARVDKQQVLDMLFSAFEKHQFYNIKDLVDITKQPVVSYITVTLHNNTHTLLFRGLGLVSPLL